jgi:hypothetical protein
MIMWGFAHQWLVDRWGYGGYGPIHMIIWIILVIAFVVGVMWRIVMAQQKKVILNSFCLGGPSPMSVLRCCPCEGRLNNYR